MPKGCDITHRYRGINNAGTFARPPARYYFALDEYPGNGRSLATHATFSIFGGNWHRDGCEWPRDWSYNQ